MTLVHTIAYCQCGARSDLPQLWIFGEESLADGYINSTTIYQIKFGLAIKSQPN